MSLSSWFLAAISCFLGPYSADIVQMLTNINKPQRAWLTGMKPAVSDSTAYLQNNTEFDLYPRGSHFHTKNSTRNIILYLLPALSLIITVSGVSSD